MPEGPEIRRAADRDPLSAGHHDIYPYLYRYLLSQLTPAPTIGENVDSREGRV